MQKLLKSAKTAEKCKNYIKVLKPLKNAKTDKKC